MSCAYAGCINITSLCLTPEATVQAAAAPGGQRSCITYVDLSDCRAVTDGGLQLVAAYCSRLVCLFLRRCPLVSDVGVQYVSTYCTELRDVSLNDCRAVTDLGLTHLARSMALTARYLSLSKCSIGDAGENNS